MTAQGAKTWIEINASHYQENIQALRSLLEKEVTFCSVLKANAYGHGIEQCITLNGRYGIKHIAVDSIDEAQIVRKHYREATIFILGFTPKERFVDIIESQSIQTVYDEHTIYQLGEIASQQQKQAFVSLKIETGTQRQGAPLGDIKYLLAAIEKQKGRVKLISIASHFSSSEQIAKKYTIIEQNSCFAKAIEVCKQFGSNPLFEHISCSASALLYPQTHHSLVRFGIAHYGLWPSQEVKEQMSNIKPLFRLKPVLTWKTKIAQIKDIASGTPVGYGQTFVSDRPMRIAILPVGYYDGFVRKLSKASHVLIKGQKCHVLGTICMNMCIVDISALPNIDIGDEVILLGRGGMHEITADDHALWTDTINYEVTTRINPLLPRIIVS